MQPHVVFLSSCITGLVLEIAPMGFSPQTPSFTNVSFGDSPDPLTGHSHLLHALRIFVGKRGLTCMQNVPLHSTHSSDCLSSSVCNLMRSRPIHLLLPAYCVQRSPLIYPSNRIQLDRAPHCIWCSKMCFNDSCLWCLHATTQAASDNPRFQPQGRRGLLSFFFFKVCASQGRVTLAPKSLWGVCAPNRPLGC